jgi:hypothetical protein
MVMGLAAIDRDLHDHHPLMPRGVDSYFFLISEIPQQAHLVSL